MVWSGLPYLITWLMILFVYVTEIVITASFADGFVYLVWNILRTYDSFNGLFPALYSDYILFIKCDLGCMADLRILEYACCSLNAMLFELVEVVFYLCFVGFLHLVRLLYLMYHLVLSIVEVYLDGVYLHLYIGSAYKVGA